MGASAALSIPMTFATPFAKAEALKILAGAAGSSDVAFDAGASAATLKLQIPGALDKIVGKLASRGASVNGWVSVAVPVVPYSTESSVDPTQLIAHLNESPAVREASYDGKTVGAKIYPSTNAMRYLFEELLVAGLKPVDVPTVAGPQEFVL